MGGLTFREFLFGDAVLLYTDIGSDSVTSYYPDFVHLSNYLRTVTDFLPGHSTLGWVRTLPYAAGFLVWEPICWLPSDWIAQALVFQHLAKILIAGLLFFRFLQLRRLGFPAALLGALLLAFSAYLCMGGCWYPLADEVVCFAAILLVAEEAIQHGRWLLSGLAGRVRRNDHPIPSLSLRRVSRASTFQSALRTLRMAAEASSCAPPFALAAVATLGAGLGAVVTLPYLHDLLSSPRGSGTTSSLCGPELRSALWF